MANIRKFNMSMATEVQELTTALYHRAIRRVFKVPLQSDEFYDVLFQLRSATRNPFAVSPQEFLDKRDRVEELYLKNILSLSTIKLNDILVCHDNASPTRSSRVLNAILNELTHRTLLSGVTAMPDTTSSKEGDNDEDAR